jgi:hypothetical protein
VACVVFRIATKVGNTKYALFGEIEKGRADRAPRLGDSVTNRSAGDRNRRYRALSDIAASVRFHTTRGDPQATFMVLTDDRPLPTVEATVEKVGRSTSAKGDNGTSNHPVRNELKTRQSIGLRLTNGSFRVDRQPDSIYFVEKLPELTSPA